MASDRNGLDQTALLLIESLQRFLSEGGKLWPMVEAVARQVGLLENLRPTFAHRILTTTELIATLDEPSE